MANNKADPVIITSPTSSNSSWVSGEPTPTQSPINDQVRQVTSKLKQTSMADYLKSQADSGQGSSGATPSDINQTFDTSNLPEMIKLNGVMYSIVKDETGGEQGETKWQHGLVSENAAPSLIRPPCNYGSQPVKFIVGEEQNIVYIHRNLLTCAPGLEKLVADAHSEAVHVPEHNIVSFTDLFDWLYKGHWNSIMDNGVVGYLYCMAIQYNIPELKHQLLCYFRIHGDPSSFIDSFLVQVEKIYNALHLEDENLVEEDPFRAFYRSTLAILYSTSLLNPISDGWHSHFFQSKLVNFARGGGRLAADTMCAILESGIAKNETGMADDKQWADAVEEDTGLDPPCNPPPVTAYDQDGDEDTISSGWGNAGGAAGDSWGLKPVGATVNNVSGNNAYDEEHDPDQSNNNRKWKNSSNDDDMVADEMARAIVPEESAYWEDAEPQTAVKDHSAPASTQPAPWSGPARATLYDQMPLKENHIFRQQRHFQDRLAPSLPSPGYVPFSHLGHFNRACPPAYAPVPHSYYPAQYASLSSAYPLPHNPAEQNWQSAWTIPPSQQAKADVNPPTNADALPDRASGRFTPDFIRKHVRKQWLDSSSGEW